MTKMHIDSEGKLRCPSEPSIITYGNPFPTRNGYPNGFSEPADGFVLHTEVGYEHNVISEFENPGSQASAFFSIGMDGHIHQYGPVGKGWAAWTQASGNSKYRGTEHEDYGNPNNRFSDKQMSSTAAVLEAVSSHDGFPLEPTDNPNGGRGVIFHSDGGVAWGGHDCPGSVRRSQRGEIIRRSKEIRRGHTHPPVPPKHELELLYRAVGLKPKDKWRFPLGLYLAAIKHDKPRSLEKKIFGYKTSHSWGGYLKRKRIISIHRIQHAVGVKQDGVFGKTTQTGIDRLHKRFK